MSRILPHVWPLVFLIALWWLVVIIFDVPHFILPAPDRVALTLLTSLPLLGGHALTTGLEIICGLMLGSAIGFSVACLIGDSKRLQKLTMPALVISQSLPVFAIAPILMLWLGYGFASKLAMTTLIVFFPVTASTLAGLRAIRIYPVGAARLRRCHDQRRKLCDIVHRVYPQLPLFGTKPYYRPPATPQGRFLWP